MHPKDEGETAWPTIEPQTPGLRPRASKPTARPPRRKRAPRAEDAGAKANTESTKAGMPTEEESEEEIDETPPIDVYVDEERVADEVLEWLAKEEPPVLFNRGGSLVRVLTGGGAERSPLVQRPPDAPRIHTASRANLREVLSRRIFVKDGRPCSVPDAIVRAIHERGEYPTLPPLIGVVDHPVLRSDGSVFFRVGYDAKTELFVYSEVDYPRIIEKPSRADAARACAELLDVFADFPFAKPTHQAAAIAAVLTPLARSAFHGPVPLVAIDKNVRGAGGTLLADAIGMIVSGREMPRTPAAKDAEEERKRITAIALAGDSVVLIDNVAGQLGTDALDAALTGTSWRDRILGKSTMTAELPLTVTFFATGNNLEFGADTTRRVMHVRLESPAEKPEERTGFRHHPLLEWIRAERPRLVAAALTLLRSYIVAGRPDVGLVPWGSYDAWSSVVRGAVVWAGLPDPGKTREELTTTADGERNALFDLLGAWESIFGKRGATIAEALKWIEKANAFDVNALQLKGALSELCPTAKADMLPSARALGARMKKLRGRVVGGLALDAHTGKSATGIRMVVRQVSSDSDDADDSVTIPLSKKVTEQPGSRESLAAPESLPRRMRRRSEAPSVHGRSTS